MDTDTEKQRGFAFPGVFEITAMGSASAQLETAIPHELERAGLTVLHETVSSRASSARPLRVGQPEFQGRFARRV